MFMEMQSIALRAHSTTWHRGHERATLCMAGRGGSVHLIWHCKPFPLGKKVLVLMDEQTSPIHASATELMFTLLCFMSGVEKPMLPHGVNHVPDHKHMD